MMIFRIIWKFRKYLLIVACITIVGYVVKVFLDGLKYGDLKNDYTKLEKKVEKDSLSHLQAVKDTSKVYRSKIKEKVATIEDLEGDKKIMKGQIMELQHDYSNCGKNYRAIIDSLKLKCGCPKCKFINF